MAEDVNTSSSSSGSGLTSALPFVGAALDFGSNIVGGLFNANQARKNRAFQERMYNKQVEDSISFWKMEQAYNHPQKVLERMKSAGLNPLLMYGDGASGLTASSQPSLPSAPSGAQGQMSGHTNFGQALAQTALLRAQIENIDADTEQKRASTEGQSNQNWLFDQTRNVEIALKYRDYDYVNQLIDESRNRVFQSSFVNANEMASLALQNELAIRKQNLSEFEVGNNVMQGWQAVLSGRISANAAMKNAFANMMRATNEAKLVPYQIGVMRETAFRLHQEGLNLKMQRPLQQEWMQRQNMMLRKQVSWYDVLQESNISHQQAQIFLENMQGQYYRTKEDLAPVEMMMGPMNMLFGFGAGLYTGVGNPGRLRVKGFGQ